jgi:hypothetical protein
MSLLMTTKFRFSIGVSVTIRLLKNVFGISLQDIARLAILINNVYNGVSLDSLLKFPANLG